MTPRRASRGPEALRRRGGRPPRRWRLRRRPRPRRGPCRGGGRGNGRGGGRRPSQRSASAQWVFLKFGFLSFCLRSARMRAPCNKKLEPLNQKPDQTHAEENATGAFKVLCLNRVLRNRSWSCSSLFEPPPGPGRRQDEARGPRKVPAASGEARKSRSRPKTRRGDLERQGPHVVGCNV